MFNHLSNLTNSGTKLVLGDYNETSFVSKDMNDFPNVDYSQREQEHPIKIVLDSSNSQDPFFNQDIYNLNSKERFKKRDLDGLDLQYQQQRNAQMKIKHTPSRNRSPAHKYYESYSKPVPQMIEGQDNAAKSSSMVEYDDQINAVGNTGDSISRVSVGWNNQKGYQVPPRARNYQEASPYTSNTASKVIGSPFSINPQQVNYLPLENDGDIKQTDQNTPGGYQAFPNDSFNSYFPSSLNPQTNNSFQYSMRSDLSSKTQIQGSVVSFHSIRYEVKVKKMPWSKPVLKTILQGVDGIMRPGINAIMGPTGSGKSSLLDVLAGRKDPRFMKGMVLIDGQPQPKNFKCISGYVVQDDIVMGTLTVRENLHFSAALRLSSDVTSKDRRFKVEEVIEELGLQSVADSKIGTELIRGVSGGERKRTNIGMELITDPKVLFLDEPTTGLDSFTASQVIRTLKTLSRRGRTIIFSLHQPKYSIYKLFDTLTLVCRGNIVYHGAAGKVAIRYFNRLGYTCEEHDNPTDFFMDILHGEASMINQDPNQATDSETIVQDSTMHRHQLNQVANKLATEWKESNEGKKIKDEIDRIAAERTLSGQSNKSSDSISEVSFGSGFLNQLRWVCWRTGLNLLRDPNASIVQTIVYLFFAISMGVVYFQLDNSLESGVQNRSGLFFFSALQVIFVNLGSIEMFIKERAIFIHENSSGYYRVSSYFFAKIFCDILPTKALPILLFMVITYFMANLRTDAGAFFFFELILITTTLSAAGIALLVSASVTMFSIANVIVSISYVFMMVFGGYLINLNSMGVWLSWLRYLSIFRYCWSGLLVNEMPTLNFCSKTNQTTVSGVNSSRPCQSGTSVLQDYGIPYGTAWDLWVNFFGMLMLCIVFYVICYIQLRRINKYK